MFREMRRQDRTLDESRVRELLQSAEYGVLSTTSIGGWAYGVPLSFACDDQVIYFHCAQEGHKVENITAFPLVSFCIVGATQVLPASFSTGYESVIVFGTIENVEDAAEKVKALRMLVKKYSPGYIAEGESYIERAAQKTKVLKLSIQRVTGKGRKP